MITLYQFHPTWNLPNASPFCMKVETYLRMTGIPYENKFIHNPQQAPKGKLPYMQIDGVNYPDSELMIDELKARYGDSLDRHLTQEQRAISLFIEHTFAEELYWLVVYLRWKDNDGWAQVKPAYFGQLPTVPQLFIPNMIRKKMLKALDYQGTGRYTLDEVIHLGRKSIDALGEILGNNAYIFGGTPSSIDATAFAFMANLLMSPVDNELKQHALKANIFLPYCHRIWDAFFADYPKPTI